MKTGNHYERAFAQFLQCQEIPYLATRETQRCFAGQQDCGSLKNLDFLAFNRRNCRYLWESDSSDPGKRDESRISWLIDIKGRRFPSGKSSPQYWRNWVSEDDLLSMARWEALLGQGFHGLLVFAYHVLAEKSPIERARLFLFEENYYAFMGIPVTTYSSHCHILSPRWRTYTMPSAEFRQMVRPIQAWLE